MKVTLRKRKLKNKTSLYLDIYSQGQRERVNLGMYLTNDKETNKETLLLANKIRTKREAELQNNVHGFVPDYKKQTSFIKYFESKIKPNSKWTVKHSTLKHIKEFTKSKDVSFNQINEKWLENFKVYLFSKVSSNSASIYFQKTKEALSAAKFEKIIITNPAEFVKNIPMKDSKREYLTEDEIIMLVNTKCYNTEIKQAFIFACFTGLRFSDIKRLEWSNIKKDHIELVQKKTDDNIYIPLSSTAKSILDNKQRNVSYFPSVKIFQLPNRWFYNEILKRWFKEANIGKNASSHVARHTYATLNLTKGTDLFTVSKLLGHKNLKTTQIYGKIIDKKKKEAVDRLPEIKINI